MRARLAGILLFLPVPLVLGLFTRLPLGTLPSLGLGTVLMLSHRLYARPFALSRALSRCLYCGGPGMSGPVLAYREPMGETSWRCCRETHAVRVGRVLGWAARHSSFLKVGILGALGLFVPGAALSGLGLLGPLTTMDMVATFRVMIALTVLPFSFLSPAFPPRGDQVRVPFPLHIQALIGTQSVLWLFRIVGVIWLLMGLAHGLDRAHLLP
ncbi:MAG TPA: hypothetical protein VN083_00055 [Vicinamibacteria bacterium]|nr:hypothetical protein [Vicinamibacteria bacterium]